MVEVATGPEYQLRGIVKSVFSIGLLGNLDLLLHVIISYRSHRRYPQRSGFAHPATSFLITS